MKNFILYIFFFGILLPPIIGQSVCDQFLDAAQKTIQDTLKKRSFRMISHIKDDKNRNITEADTFGRIHFWGDVGSLKMESFYADGKQYSKIQSDFIKNDEWTWQELKVNKPNANRWFDMFRNEIQNIDCQLIGVEKIKSKTCAILAYSLQKWMPKRNGVDSFLMTINVKTWFCADNNLVYKHSYEMTTERLSQTVNATIEYDVPVKIDVPKKAKYEPQSPIKMPPSVRNDTNQRYEERKITPSDSTKTQDSLTVFTAVDQAAEYKEGLSALYKYISNNMHFPEEARKEGLSGTVQVSFIVEIDGSLTNIQVKKSVREDVDTEAIRVVKSMSGAWKAGKINGKDVRSTFILPLRFELRE